MASKSMKDIQAAIDDAIDNDDTGTAWDMEPRAQQDANMNAVRENPDRRHDEDVNDQRHQYQFNNPNDPDAMSTNPQMPGAGPSGAGPIQAAMTHIQRGNATPEEMMMLRQVLNGPMPSANVDDDGEDFAARHAGTGRAGALMDAEDQMNGR